MSRGARAPRLVREPSRPVHLGPSGKRACVPPPSPLTLRVHDSEEGRPPRSHSGLVSPSCSVLSQLPRLPLCPRHSETLSEQHVRPPSWTNAPSGTHEQTQAGATRNVHAATDGCSGLLQREKLPQHLDTPTRVCARAWETCPSAGWTRGQMACPSRVLRRIRTCRVDSCSGPRNRAPGPPGSPTCPPAWCPTTVFSPSEVPLQELRVMARLRTWPLPVPMGAGWSPAWDKPNSRERFRLQTQPASEAGRQQTEIPAHGAGSETEKTNQPTGRKRVVCVT